MTKSIWTLNLLILLGGTQVAAVNGPQGGSGGGSLSCNTGQLVEKFCGKSPHDLPGFDLAAERLRKFVPVWVDEQVASIESKNICFIKCTISQIPSGSTQLYFQSPNPCYQTADNKEMFCEERVARSRDPKKWEDFFIHELTVAAAIKQGVSIANVRAANTVLLQKNISYVEVARTLSENLLGNRSNLLAAEYVQSIGQRVDSLPIWESEIHQRHCSFQPQGTYYGGVTRVNPTSLSYDQNIPVGRFLGLYNGFMFTSKVSPLLDRNMNWIRGYIILDLFRQRHPGSEWRTQNESLSFICKAPQPNSY